MNLEYRIIVWHKDSVNGTHQSTLCSAKTQAKVLRDFNRYLQLPSAMRSFNQHNTIQLHHIDHGVIAHFPPSLRG
jgi:hypothetical protein